MQGIRVCQPRVAAEPGCNKSAAGRSASINRHISRGDSAMLDPKLDLVLERVSTPRPRPSGARGPNRGSSRSGSARGRGWRRNARSTWAPGGTFHTVFQGPDGTTLDNPGCYLEVVPNRRLVFTTALGPGLPPAGPLHPVHGDHHAGAEGQGNAVPCARPPQGRGDCEAARGDGISRGMEQGAGPARRDGEHRVAGPLKPDVTKAVVRLRFRAFRDMIDVKERPGEQDKRAGLMARRTTCSLT